MTRAEKRERVKKRLDMYYAAEEAIVGGAQSYSLGSRSLTRANLDSIRAMINSLEKELSELESRSPRKAFGVIPRDY